jgi:hypothetical protein
MIWQILTPRQPAADGRASCSRLRSLIQHLCRHRPIILLFAANVAQGAPVAVDGDEDWGVPLVIDDEGGAFQMMIFLKYRPVGRDVPPPQENVQRAAAANATTMSHDESHFVVRQVALRLSHARVIAFGDHCCLLLSGCGARFVLRYAASAPRVALSIALVYEHDKTEARPFFHLQQLTIAAACVKNQEPRTKNQEPRTENQEPRTENQEPRTKNREPRTKNQEPRTENQEPRTENQEPRTKN